MTWDPSAAAHLARLARRIDDAGVTAHVREVAQDLWRANVERHDPDALFDDSSTLGYSASKNVGNRLFEELRAPNGALQPRAVAIRDLQSTVVRVGDVLIHFVKVPVARGRKPRFAFDFSWETREGRAAAAARNAQQYSAPLLQEGHEPMFEIQVPDAAERAARCLDVFIVWGGDMEGLTAGWIGLPTSGSSSWLAVQDAWFDEDLEGGLSRNKPVGPVGGPTFSQIEAPAPRITLKPKSDEGTANA